MNLISHRGNKFGPDKFGIENTKQQIDTCLYEGYMVEIDVWWVNNHLYLGHDTPDQLVDFDFLYLNKEKLLCHAKNVSALYFLMSNDFHCFWHNKDDYTITNLGIPICYPNRTFFPGCILMQPEKSHWYPTDKNVLWGVCSDYIERYK